jgi:hypothetical protein
MAKTTTTLRSVLLLVCLSIFAAGVGERLAADPGTESVPDVDCEQVPCSEIVYVEFGGSCGRCEVWQSAASVRFCSVVGTECKRYTQKFEYCKGTCENDPKTNCDPGWKTCPAP